LNKGDNSYENSRGAHKSLMLADQIIATAKAKYPSSVCVEGRLTEEERKKIETECRINTTSVHMDGNHTYYIRWEGLKNDGDS
jgi:hypothetical protein